VTYTLAVAKQKISIGGAIVGAFRDATGVYSASCKDIATAVGKRVCSINYYLESLKDREIGQIALGLNGEVLNAIPLEISTGYIDYWAAQRQLQAINLKYLLSKESLMSRVSSAFENSKTSCDRVDTSDWLMSRKATADIHAVFHNYCNVGYLPGGHIHDAMTQLVFHQSAKDAKLKNKLVGLNPNVGLDYQHEEQGLLLIARMKLKFCTYRSGTWQQRVVAAYEDCIDFVRY
jgi:hypothetical protein